MRPSLVHCNGPTPSKEGLSRRIWYDQVGSHGKIKSVDYWVMPSLLLHHATKHAVACSALRLRPTKILPPRPIRLNPYVTSGSAIRS